MEILSWNVNGTFPPQGSPDLIQSQIEWLDSRPTVPDVLMLQEVNPNRREMWHDLLRDQLGYHDIRDTIDWAQEFENSNGHLTAVTPQWEQSENTLGRGGDGRGSPDPPALAFPEKLLITEIHDGETSIQIWNVRAVPGGSYPEAKIELLEWIYDRIASGDDRIRVLGGDLNTPKRELSDGQAVTYGLEREPGLRDRAVNAELRILRGLGHHGMIDAFRSLHGYGDLDVRDTSHDDRRIDHLFVSEELELMSCHYSGGGAEHSDHAPLVLDCER